MARMVKCAKLGVEKEGLDRPPYPGELGKRIFDTVSKEAWQRWLAHQTMIINENRLNPMEPTARELLRTEMEKYLFGSGSDLPKGYVPPEGQSR